MSKEWRINTRKPGSGLPNNPELVGCMLFRNDAEICYEFIGPTGTVEARTPGTLLPLGRFDFPRFDAKLNGPIKQEWYITVDAVDNRSATGTFGHHGYKRPETEPEEGEGESDTWVAQAGAGAGDDEPDEAAAKAAAVASKQ